MDWMDCTNPDPYYDDIAHFNYLEGISYDGFDNTLIIPNDFEHSGSCMAVPGLSPASEESSNSQTTSSITCYDDTFDKDLYRQSISPTTSCHDLRTQSPTQILSGVASHLPYEPWSQNHIEPSAPNNTLNVTTCGTLTCTEGCEKGTFGRRYELNRHIKEQHRCPHDDCKDVRFSTPKEKRDHERRHSETGIGYRCGTCSNQGTQTNTLTRAEKMKKHFKDIHKMPDDFDYRSFQCEVEPCYLGKACGGTFFTSRDEYMEHKAREHITMSKRPLDHGHGSESKRGKLKKHDSAMSSPQSPSSLFANPTDPSTSFEPSSSISKVSTLVGLDIQQGGSHEPVATGQPSSTPPNEKIEESIGLSVIEMQALTKHESWRSVLDQLSAMQLTSTFDPRNSAIKLRCTCTSTALEKGKALLENLINDSRPTTLGYETLESAVLEKKRSGFHQHVSSHPQPEILALDPQQDANYLQLWNDELLAEFPEIVQEASIEGSYSVSLVRQKGPNGSFPIIRFRSSENQSEISRQIIRDRVLVICERSSHPTLSVQFTQGTLVRLVGGPASGTVMDDPSNDRTFPHQRRYWDIPGMGASLALGHCCCLSATLGGYISVNGRKYVLSVDHFISECACNIPTEFPSRCDEVRSPAIIDVCDVKRHLTSKMKELGLKISRSVGGEISLGQVGQIFSGEIEQELALYERFDMESLRSSAFGRVRVRCGGGQLPLRPSANPKLAGKHHRMDWSLTEVTAGHREGKNVHRHGRNHHPSPGDFANELIRPEGTGVPCVETGYVKGGEGIHYMGTTSGLREGVVNPAIVQYGGRNGVSHEWAMIVPNCEQLRDADFKGDSGAFIINDQHQLLGLLWGWENGNLLFTPIQEVFSDIAQKMGLHNIRLPDMSPRPEGTGLLCRRSLPIPPAELPEDTITKIPVHMLSPSDAEKKARRRRSSGASSTSSGRSVSSIPGLSSSASSAILTDEPSPRNSTAETPLLFSGEPLIMKQLSIRSRPLPNSLGGEWEFVQHERAAEEQIPHTLGLLNQGQAIVV